MLVWDDAKRAENRRKHGLDFTDMARFDWDSAVFVKTETVESEQRETVVGRIGLAIVTAVYTERGDDLRMISLRRATRYEQRRWSDEQ